MTESVFHFATQTVEAFFKRSYVSNHVCCICCDNTYLNPILYKYRSQSIDNVCTCVFCMDCLENLVTSSLKDLGSNGMIVCKSCDKNVSDSIVHYVNGKYYEKLYEIRFSRIVNCHYEKTIAESTLGNDILILSNKINQNIHPYKFFKNVYNFDETISFKQNILTLEINFLSFLSRDVVKIVEKDLDIDSETYYETPIHLFHIAFAEARGKLLAYKFLKQKIERYQQTPYLKYLEKAQEIVNPKCPDCLTIIGWFDGCFSIECQCKKNICGWCLRSFEKSRDSHLHIIHCSKNLHPGSFYGKWKEFQIIQKEASFFRLHQYVKTIPKVFQSQVLDSMTKIEPFFDAEIFSFYWLFHRLHPKNILEFEDELFDDENIEDNLDDNILMIIQRREIALENDDDDDEADDFE